MGFGGGYPTEAVLQRALDTQTIISKLDGNTQGLCDGFYAQSNAINGLESFHLTLDHEVHQAAIVGVLIVDDVTGVIRDRSCNRTRIRCHLVLNVCLALPSQPMLREL